MDYNQMRDAALLPQTLGHRGRYSGLPSTQLFSHR